MASPIHGTGRVVIEDSLNEDAYDLRWWLSEEDQIHEAVHHAFRHLRDNDTARLQANKHHARLYGGPRNPNHADWEEATRERISLNVIKNAIDAVVAKIGKQRPAPRPLTQGGNPSLRRKAKLLERFLQAQFDLSRVYEELPKAFLDCCVFGTGAAKVFVQDERIEVERVFPSELFVDTHDGLYGKPRMVIQKKWVAREVLRGMFPSTKHQEILDAAGKGEDSAVDDPYDLFYDPRSDQVLVLESWHIASRKDGKDGCHIIAVDSGTLFLEEWKHPWLPFVFFNWSERLRGFWGQGAAEELNGIQIEINRLLRKIQSAMHLLAVPRVFVDGASKLNRSHFNNRVGQIVPYVGKPPVVVAPQTIHPEMFAHLDRLYNRAYEIIGVSQLASRQQNPLGGDASGVALQTWHDLETERFSIEAAKYEAAFLRLSKMMIAFADEIGGDFGAPAKRDRNTIDHLKWSEVNMKEDEYTLQVFPVSSLPSTPAGRLSAVVQMVNAQLIPVESAKKLLDYPDLEAELALDSAASDLIDSIIEMILDEGVMVRPEPFMDLELALKKAQFWYNKALREKVEEERLEMLRRFMRMTKRLLEAAQVEQMKAAMQAAGQNTPTNAAAPPAPGPNGQAPGAVTPEDGAVSG